MNKRDFLKATTLLVSQYPTLASSNYTIIESAPKKRLFCIDFNWTNQAIASAAEFSKADPKVHYKFYEKINANIVQTFSVALNGHSFYRGAVAPVVKDLKFDFLPEIAEICHTNGKLCYGYFCWGSNIYYTKNVINQRSIKFNPEDVYLTPTTLYKNFFMSLLEDSFLKVRYDGYLLDWFSLPITNYENTELMRRDFKSMSDIFHGILKLNAQYRKFMIVNSVDNELNNLLWQWILDDPNIFKYKNQFALLNESGLKKRHDFLSKSYTVAQNLSGWKDMDPVELAKIKSDIYYGYLPADPATTLPYMSDEKTVLKIKSVYDRLSKIKS